MEEIKPWNVRPDPEMVEWLAEHTVGNDSAVVRAAMWFLMRQPDPDAIIRTYVRRPADPTALIIVDCEAGGRIYRDQFQMQQM